MISVIMKTPVRPREPSEPMPILKVSFTFSMAWLAKDPDPSRLET
jgi:hypothetical protein